MSGERETPDLGLSRREYVKGIGMASLAGVPVGTAAGADPLADENTVSVGSGSYTTARPGGTADPPVPGGLSGNVQAPAPSNTWWGGEIYREEATGFSGDAMYHAPIGVDVKNGEYATGTDGLALFYSDGWTEDVRTSTGAHGNYDVTPGLDVGHADTSFSDCRVDGYGDWHTELLWGEGTDTTMRATVVKGSPFVFCEIDGRARIRAVNAVPKWPGQDTEGEQLSADNVSVWGFDGNRFGLTVTNSPTDGITYERHFGVYAPANATWDGVSQNGVTADALVSDLDGKGYLTVAALPSRNEALLSELERYAYNVVTDTRIDWAYSQRDGSGNVESAVETTFTFETDNKAESATGDGETVAWLYPHQYKHTDDPLTSYTAWTERGTAKLFKGSQLTTRLTYPGILPWLPSALLDDSQQSKLSGLFDELMGEYEQADSETGETYLWPYSYGVPSDTYFGGKDPFRLGNVAPMAEELDHSSADALFDAIETRVGHRVEADDQFTYDGRTYTTRDGNGNVRELFEYSTELGAFIPHDGGFGSVTDLNDHHFHFGYWVFGAGIVGLDEDPTSTDTWIDKYGDMIDLLIRDYANWERPENGSRSTGAALTGTTPRDSPKDAFPFLRCFDAWEGHSWASGTASGSGTGQESSSEAINSYAAMIRWGEARLRHAETAEEREHAREIRDTGVFLYTQEITAVLEYWFDVENDSLPADWGADLSDPADIAAADHPFEFASRVYGNGYDRGLYFAITPVHLYGINYLPVGGHSFYLGQDRGYSARQWETILTNRATPHWGYEDDPTDFPGGWTTNMHCYRALSEPEDAVGVYDTEPNNAPSDGGNTKAFAYTWTRALDNHGTPNESVVADTTFFRVFDDDTERTYCVCNPGTEPIDVSFSDGYRIEQVSAGSSVVETAPADAGGDPAAPTGLTKGQDNSYGLELSWDPSGDTDLYKYRVFVNGQHRADAFEPSTVVGDLQPGTTYRIGVSAVDESGRESDRTVITHTTTTGDNAPPETPENVAVAGTTNTTATVAWDAGDDLGTGIDHFTIQYRHAAADDETATAWENAGEQVATIEHATVFGLTAGADYEFRVLATDRAGNDSSASSVVTATLPTDEATDQSPLGGAPARIPGRIEMELYDEGPDGAAYHDSDPGNTGTQEQGVQFRADENVDVTRKGGDYAVGWTAENEWLEYTVRVERAGTYDATMRYGFSATGSTAAGPLYVLVDGAQLLGPIELEQTGGWTASDYRTVDLGSLDLPAGRHTLQLYFEAGWPEVDYVEFVPTGESPDRTAPSAPAFDDGMTTGARSVDLSWSGASDAESAVASYELFQFVPQLDRSAWSVTASDDAYGPPAQAVDGNETSKWVSGVAMNETEITYTIDMGASQRIERLVIQHGQQLDIAPEIVVETSTDGESWQALATLSGSLTIDETFEPTTTRYVRLRETTDSKAEWWKIQDIKLFAPRGSGVGQWRSIERVYDPNRTGTTVEELSAGQSYEFAIEAIDAFGNRSSRATTTVETVSPDTDSTAPTAPSTLRATSRTQTELSLAWDAASDNTGIAEYVVYQDGTEVARTGETSATVTGLAGATGYTLAVEAIDLNGNASAERATATIWTADTEGQAPYTDPIDLPAQFPAAEFDYGGQAIAYNDADATNKGGGGRTDTGVDVIQDPDGSTRIGYVEPGEWLEYTIEVPETGAYTLGVDAIRGGSPVHFEVDGTVVSGDLDGGSFDITTDGVDTVPNVQLEAGVHTLRFVVESGATATFDINGFEITRPISGGGGSATAVDPATMTATARLSDPVVDQTATYDGDTGTELTLGPPTIDQTEYGVVVDFGATETVDTLELVAGNAQDYPRSFTVEYDDGGTWQSVSPSVSTGQTTTITFPSQTTSKLRVRETDDSSAYYWRLAGIRAYADGGATALDRSGWTVTRAKADSSVETQNADLAVDGTTGAASRWQSGTAIASKAMSVTVTFDSVQTVSKVDLVHSSAGDTPSALDLEYSPDGSTWESAKTGVAGSPEMTISLASPVEAKQLRIVERDDTTTPNWWSLEEVRPYNPPSGDGTSDTTAPEPPAGVAVESVTDTSMTVAWEGSPSADVAAYSVSVGDRTTQTVGRSTQFTGLGAGTSYDVSVSAIDTAGNESTAVTATATTEVAVDYTQQFTKLGYNSGQIEFAPDESLTSVSARYRINGGSQQTMALSPVDGEMRYTGALPETLSAGDSIGYEIVYDRAGQQVVTDTYSARFEGDTIPPAPPVDLRVEDYADTTVSLSWSGSTDGDSGLAGYDLFVDGSTAQTEIGGTSTVVDGLSPATTHEFAVRAVDNAGNTSTFVRTSQRTEASSDSSPPPAPADATVTETGAAGLSLSWSGVTDDESRLAGYEVTVSGPSTDRTITTTDTSTAVTDLSSGTEYTASIVAVDTFENRSSAATVTATTTIPASESTLTAPTGLETAPATTSATVTWSAPDDTGTGVDRYVVERERDGTVEDSYVLAGTTVELVGLTSATTYTLRVTAVDAVGATATATTTLTTSEQSDTSVSTPSNVTVTPETTSLSVNWDAVPDDSGISTYRVAVDGTKRVSTAGTSAAVDDLSPDTAYEVSVTAVDAVGNEATTTRTVRTAADDAISAPTNLSETHGETTVTLSWDPATDGSGVVEYVVRTRQNGTELRSKTVDGTSATVVELAPGTTYTFAVTARDGAGNTATSEVTTTTAGDAGGVPATPTDLAIEGQTVSTISLSWTGVETATEYVVRVDGSRRTRITESTVELTGLDHGAEYDVSVVTVGSDGGASEPTPPKRVTTATLTRDRTVDALRAWRESERPTDDGVPRTDDRVDYGTVREMVAEMEEDDQ